MGREGKAGINIQISQGLKDKIDKIILSKQLENIHSGTGKKITLKSVIEELLEKFVAENESHEKPGED